MKPNVQALRDLKDIKLDRREVFKLGSAAVVTPALIGASIDWDATWAFGATAAAGTSLGPVAVGHWNAQPASTFTDAREAVEPAIDGDGIRLQVVSGGCPQLFADWDSLQSIGMRVDLRPRHTAELRVWHLQRTPVPSQSSPVPVSIPLQASDGVTCWLDIRDAQPGSEPTHILLRFAEDGQRGSLPLRSGYYAIVLGAPGSRRWTDWSSLHLAGDDCGNTLALTLNDGSQRAKSHLVFTLDGH